MHGTIVTFGCKLLLLYVKEFVPFGYLHSTGNCEIEESVSQNLFRQRAYYPCLALYHSNQLPGGYAW